MASASGTTQNLDEGSAEALQALLGSLTNQQLGPSDGDSYTPEQKRRLIEKLREVVGEENDPSQATNESAKLVNEEGLPIIDITEPVPNLQLTEASSVSALLEDRDLVPLSSLTARERERRRLHRERILDLLEEEEKRDQAHEDERSLKERREAIRKRTDVAKAEIEKMKALQKRMGKALIRPAGRTKEGQGNIETNESKQTTTSDHKTDPSPPEKTASFTGAPGKIERAEEVDSGDVALAQSTKAKKHTDSSHMKMNVVERLPTRVMLGVARSKDSDDESDIEELAEADGPSSGSEDLVEENGSDSEALESGYDLDFAQHQREIALEYCKKRDVIGAKLSEATVSRNHEGGDDWDQETVPVEATLSTTSKPKPEISKFKASRMATSPNTSGHSNSFGAFALPVDTQRVKQAIRLGKLENDQLVGGEAGESGSEDGDENMKEIVELLQKGEVQNIGPKRSLSEGISTNTDPTDLHPIITSPLSQHTDEELTAVEGATPTKAKTSRFKLSRGQPRALASTSSIAFSNDSRSQTPVSKAGRSSPKMPCSPGVVERSSFLDVKNSESSQGVSAGSVVSTSLDMEPMIIDSPSFPAPDKRMKNPVSSPPHNQSRPDRPPTIMSSVVRESNDAGRERRRTEEEDRYSERKISKFLADRMDGS